MEVWVSGSSEITELAQPTARHACEQLIHSFAWHLDQHSPPERIADLFTIDGIWELPSNELRAEGRDELVRYFGAFSPAIVSRRLCTNVLFELTATDTARASSYFTTFRVDGASGNGPLPVPPVTQVGMYSDQFRCVDGTWLIARRTTSATFVAPMPRVQAVDAVRS
ncbi:nuclear transport factor 2 family protein [Nocardia jiangxiensis]|uniref:Nuclear transport factor 2 family protein n=1 Tax=Nocardia jiangxiensis TaxID=282685 RepID=A0ABW6S2A1_9NOCA